MVAEAFIDFGGSCKAMKQSFFNKLQLECSAGDDIVIKGYGHALILPLSATTASLTVDGVELRTQFYIVPDEIQHFDVLVGQLYTELPDILVVLLLNLMFSIRIRHWILQNYDNLEKVHLYPQEDTIVKPGVKVPVRTESFTIGVMKVKLSKQRQPKGKKDVLGEEVENREGMTMIKVISRTTELDCDELNCWTPNLVGLGG